MAGAGSKLFVSGQSLTADQVNTYLMDQTVMKFATTSARDTAFGGAGEATLAEGMMCVTTDTDTIWYYTGSVWVARSVTTGLDRQVLTADSTVTGGLEFAYPSDLSLVTYSATTSFSLTDSGTFILASHASGMTLQCPTNATVPFLLGTQINVVQWNTGQVTINGSAGVTMLSASNYFKTRVRYSVLTVVKVATDTWLVLGDTAP